MKIAMTVLLSALSLPSVAEAQGPPSSSDGLRGRIETSGSHTFEQGLDGPGRVALSRAGVTGSFDAPVAPGLRAGLFGGYELAHYAFDGATGLIPGRSDPFDDFHRVTAGFQLDWRRDRFSLFARLGATWAGESDASLGGGVTWQGFGGVRWQYRDDLAFTFGLLGFTRLEDDALIVPIVGVDWRINDRLRLFTPGPGLALVAKLDHGLSLTLRGGWEGRDYRLDGGRRGLRSGVVRDDRVPISLELSTSRGPLRLGVQLGATVYQQFEIDDRTGDRISRVETDPAPFLGLRGAFRF